MKAHEGASVIISDTDTEEIWSLVENQPRTATVEGCNPGVVGLYYSFRADGAYPNSNYDKVKITVVGVDLIAIDAPPYGWCDVTGETITVLKGTKYDFCATRSPEDANWPPGCPTWCLDGVAIGTPGSELVQVTFHSPGTKTLIAKCGASDPGRSVTVQVVEPQIDQFGVDGGVALFPTPSTYSGWGEPTAAQFSNPVYYHDAAGGAHFYPFCLVKNSAPQLSNVRLSVPQPLTFPATIRVDADGTQAWNESVDVSFYGTLSNSAVLTMTDHIINSVAIYDGDFGIDWEYKVPAGTNAPYPAGTTSHTVYVKYGAGTGGHSPTEQRVRHLCQVCSSNTTAEECSTAIFVDLSTSSPPGYDYDAEAPENVWWMMDPDGPAGKCLDLASLMRAMYLLLGCEGGEIGFVYATSDTDCYSMSHAAHETRTCPVHGTEELVYYAGGTYQEWEAVFHVDGFYYAVKETMGVSPLDVIRAIVSPNTIESGNYQAWWIVQTQQICLEPLPVNLP